MFLRYGFDFPTLGQMSLLFWQSLIVKVGIRNVVIQTFHSQMLVALLSLLGLLIHSYLTYQ